MKIDVWNVEIIKGKKKNTICVVNDYNSFEKFLKNIRKLYFRQNNDIMGEFNFRISNPKILSKRGNNSAKFPIDCKFELSVNYEECTNIMSKIFGVLVSNFGGSIVKLLFFYYVECFCDFSVHAGRNLVGKNYAILSSSTR